jgi:hypothetical protein
MARRAKLSVTSGTIEFTQQIFVQIALNILILFRDFHLINQVADFYQRRRFADFKLSILHISLKRTPLGPRRPQLGKNPIAKMLESPICLKVNPVRPPQFWVNLGFKGLIAAFCLFLALVLGVV